jgi:riboflavin synthase
VTLITRSFEIVFTGIVEELGTVGSIKSGVLIVDASLVLEDMDVKDSICVNGACLTVTELTGTGFQVDVVPETLRRTNLGALTSGSKVNLERSLQMGGRLGGHIVQGHVDGTGEISSIAEDGDAYLYSFSVSPELSRYIVQKGFICVDGISLTVVNCADDEFTVTLIPYTREHTVLGTKSEGNKVNLEADIMAKYIEKLSNGGGYINLD